MNAKPPTIGAKLAAEAIGTFMITAVAPKSSTTLV